MRIFQQLKWIAMVLIVFFVILATNLIDKDNFERVEHSVETIYKDVLLTKDKIMEINNLIHEKEVAYITKDSVYLVKKSASVNSHINMLIRDCGEVIETQKEAKVLDKLQKDCNELYAMEINAAIDTSGDNAEILKQLESIKYGIIEMADLHIEEGKRHKYNSRSAMDATRLFSRIEIYLLFFLAIVIQFIILYKPKEKNYRSEDEGVVK